MTARRRPSTTRHGYANYTSGCRCLICRRAKATYMAEKRAEARRHASEHGVPIGGVKHGTANAYDAHGCRCQPCIDAAYAWKNPRRAA